MQYHHEKAITEVMVLDILKQQLPEAKALQKKLAKGEMLNDFDLQHLEYLLHYAHEALPHIQLHKEFEPISRKIIQLYKQVVNSALQAELNAHANNMSRIQAKVIKGGMLGQDID